MAHVVWYHCVPGPVSCVPVLGKRLANQRHLARCCWNVVGSFQGDCDCWIDPSKIESTNRGNAERLWGTEELSRGEMRKMKKSLDSVVAECCL